MGGATGPPRLPRFRPHCKRTSRSWFWIIPDTKMTNTFPFLWNGSSKIQFFTDIWYSSWRGCWGQPMSFFWKLVDETQMCNPPEATRHHNLIKLLILLPLRAIYFRTFQCEIPCNKGNPHKVRFQTKTQNVTLMVAVF